MGLFGSIVSLFRTKADYSRAGVGGAQTVGPYLVSNEKNAKIATLKRRIQTYQEISYNTSIIATGLRYIGALVSSTNWNLHPPIAKDPDGKLPGWLTPAEAAKAKDYADWIEQSWNYMDTPWYKVVRDASSFKWIGFSVLECIAKRMDEVQPGFIAIGAIENRPQHTFELWYLDEQSGDVTGWRQRAPITNETYELDREKCVYLVDDALTSQPDGIGLLRHVVELVEQLKRLEQLELWAYETDLRGVPIGRAPTAILDDMVAKNRLTREQADVKVKGIQDFITNHVLNPELGLLLDSGAYTGQDATKTPSQMKMWDLELVKGSGVGLADIDKAIQRKQHEIARVIGVEQFMLGAGGKGSLALSEDKARALIELINAIIMEIAWCLRRDYIRKIFVLNRWDIRLMPEILPDPVALRSVSVIVDAISKMALAGAILDRNDPLINQVRSMLKLVDQPFVTDEMKMATPAPNSGGTPGVKAPTKGPPLPVSKKAMEDIVERLQNDDVEGGIQQLMDLIREAA
jgi:hypothetical protein